MAKKTVGKGVGKASLGSVEAGSDKLLLAALDAPDLPPVNSAM